MKTKITAIVIVAVGVGCILYSSSFWLISQMIKGMPSSHAITIIENTLTNCVVTARDRDILDYAKGAILYKERSYLRLATVEAPRQAIVAIISGIALVYAGYLIGRVRRRPEGRTRPSSVPRSAGPAEG
ncbi:MAG TPA: hypothetical protein PLE77_13535 [Kiritimatiellia bacterium]|nr:hypothetical protein [Kiritimatiellia bacterium]